MQVETYEVTELDETGELECEADAVALIEELELADQKELVSDYGKTKQRMPYRKMTAEEYRVYDTIFEKKANIRTYSDEPIPLRVLQVAAHAKTVYDELQVWHKPNADIKDPILVGVKGKGYTDKEFYILARWGDTLAPWAEIVKHAASILRENLRNVLQETIDTATSRLAAMAAVPDDAFARGDKHTLAPTVYWK